MDADPPILDRLRAALGRRGPLASAPTPPAIVEPITRLVHAEVGLADLFARQAEANHFHVWRGDAGQVVAAVAGLLSQHRCRRLAMPRSPLLEKLGIAQALREAGFEVRLWDGLSADDLFDLDASVTDVCCAVAEVGALVIRSSPEHGRAISLAPPIHVAIIEPRNILCDLLDLFEKLSAEPPATGTVIITGPSKTADIEMNIVTGVHGPGVAAVFVLQ